MRLQKFIAGLLLIASAAVAVAASDKPNVLFIAFDDLRPDLGCYGSKIVKSPNMDKLASQGLLFNRAYCQYPVCNPSRASLLTGVRPETLDIFDLETSVRMKHPDVVTLPQHFREHGYETVSIGKIFHVSQGNPGDPLAWSDGLYSGGNRAKQQPLEVTTSTRRGLSANPVVTPRPAPGPKNPRGPSWESPDVADDELPDGKEADTAIGKLREMKDKPFFLAVGFHKPHLPFIAPKKYWDMYEGTSIPLAGFQSVPQGAPAYASNNSGELRQYQGVNKEGPIPEDLQYNMLRGYYACVTYVDAQLGRVVDELDRLGLRDNTVIIVWGDHGYQLGEHGTWCKATAWENPARVPMMLSVPEKLASQNARGKRTDALVEFVDIFPTLSELCGLPLPEQLEGTSMVPLLESPDREWKSAAFTTQARSVPGEGRRLARAMRTDRYRFVAWSGGGADEQPVYELYDMVKDPEEMVNIANEGENAELVKELAARLAKGWKGERPAKR